MSPANVPSPAFGDPCGPWHHWFAWKPIRSYDRRLVWLRFVWRRSVFKHQYLGGGGPDFWWQYAHPEHPAS